MADNKVTVDFEVIGNAAKRIDEISNSVTKLSETLDTKLTKGSQAFAVFTGSVASDLAVKALGALTDAASELFNVFVKDGVKAASEQEDAINSLNRSLAAAGKYSAQSSNSFLEFADAIQKTTRFADEQVVSAGALLGSIARLDSQGLQRGTQAAIDMASALKIDLDTAIRLVGKGAEGNVDAFKRYGIEVQQGADKATTFANVLDALNSRFGGAASSDALTFSGAMAQLKNQFGEVQEAVGELIIQNPALTGVISATSKVVGDLSGWVRENAQVIQEWIAKGIQVAIASLRALLDVANAVTFGQFSEQLRVADDAMKSMGAAADEGTAKILNGMKAAQPEVKNTTAAVVELDEAQKKLIENGDKLIEQNSRKAMTTQQALEADLAAVDAAEANKLSRVGANEEQRYIIQSEALAARQQLYADADAKEIEDLQSKNATLRAINDEKAMEEIDRNNSVIAAKLALMDMENAKAKKLADDQEKAEKNLNRKKRDAAADTFGNLTILAQEAGRDGFEIAKATAIAQGVINTTSAVIAALDDAPFPFNIALAASIGAVGALNVAKIASSQPPSFASGIDEVPAGFGNDRFPAFLQTGERVVPAQTNRDLKGFLQDSGGMAEILGEISAKLDRLQNTFTVNIGERTIANEVRSAIESGRVVFA